MRSSVYTIKRTLQLLSYDNINVNSPTVWLCSVSGCGVRLCSVKTCTIENTVKVRAVQKSTGCFFLHWYPPQKLKYGKPRIGESTLT